MNTPPIQSTPFSFLAQRKAATSVALLFFAIAVIGALAFGKVGHLASLDERVKVLLTAGGGASFVISLFLGVLKYKNLRKKEIEDLKRFEAQKKLKEDEAEVARRQKENDEKIEKLKKDMDAAQLEGGQPLPPLEPETLDLEIHIDGKAPIHPKPQPVAPTVKSIVPPPAAPNPLPAAPQPPAIATPVPSPIAMNPIEERERVLKTISLNFDFTFYPTCNVTLNEPPHSYFQIYNPYQLSCNDFEGFILSRLKLQNVVLIHSRLKRPLSAFSHLKIEEVFMLHDELSFCAVPDDDAPPPNASLPNPPSPPNSSSLSPSPSSAAPSIDAAPVVT